MPKRKQKSGGDIPEWVVTYGDLMSLLLCFFILLAAFSEIKDPDEFQKVIEAVKEALGATGGAGSVRNAGPPETSAMVPNDKIQQLADMVKQANPPSSPNRSVPGPEDKSTIVQPGLYQVIGGALPFEAGVTELTPAVQHTLMHEVAPKIRDRMNIVEIVGHAAGAEDTTAGPPAVVGFERAFAVFDYLVQECGVDPKILRIVSAGRSEPAADDDVGSRRVQVYATDKLITQVNADAFGTGRAP